MSHEDIPVVDIVPTYKDTLGPARYHRCVNREHMAANLNGGGSFPVYLWYKQDPSADPVVDIKVLYDGEDKPEGYKRASRDLAKGTAKKVHICFKTEKVEPEAKVQPICELVVVYDDESPGEDWEKVDRSLNGAGNSVFLWLRRGKPEDDTWEPEKLEVGDLIDCQDSVNKWCVATVVERREDKVRVRYKGWGSRWDDTLPVTSSRIAKAGTKNAQSGPKRVKQGDDWPIEEKEIVDYEEKVSDLLAGKLDAETAAKVENVQLLDWVERNMQANHVPEESKVRVNDSFKKVYEVICARLKRTTAPVPKSVLAMWNQLMLGDVKAYWFFQKGGGCAPDSEEGKAVAGEFGRLPPGGASRFFVDNINKFGTEGGFEAVIQRVQMRDAELAPISEVFVMLKLLCICRFCYNPDFGTPYFTKLIPMVMERIKFIDNDDVKELDQALATQMVNEITACIGHLCPDLNVDEVQSVIKLNIIRRVINCKYMVKRLAGLKSLGQLCERATAITARNPEMDGLSAAGPLADWIVEHDVLRSLMGMKVGGKTYGTHVEIIKKLPPLLKFLARRNKVDAAVLDQLWAPLEHANPGDSTTRAIFDLVSQLSNDLSLEHLDAVFERIAGIPHERIDGVALDLIKQFTAKALYKAAGEGDRWYGIALLWELIQDDSRAPEKTCAAAQTVLVHLLTKLHHCQVLVPKVLEKCMTNLQRGTSVVPALQVAKAIVKSLPVYGARGSAGATAPHTRQDVLDGLQETYGVVDAITADIARYKEAATAAKADRTGSVAEEVLVGRHSHKDQLEARLEFLRFHLDDSAAELDFDSVKALWLALSSDPVDSVDVSLFFDWLRKARFNDDAQAYSSTLCVAFNDDVVGQIFTDLLCNEDYLPAATVPLAGFQTLLAFFKFVNVKAARMDARDNVSNPELVGLDVLWTVALGAGTGEVRRAATEALIALHVKLAPALDKKEVWGRFVEQTMRRVASHLEGDVSNADESAIASLLRVLRTFLREVEESGKEVPTSRFTVYVRHPTGSYQAGTRTVHVPCTPEITVQELREAVATLVGHPANQVRLETFNCKVLRASTHNATRVTDHVSSRALEAQLLTRPDPSTVDHTAPVVATEDLDEDRRYPRELLSSEYFVQLFDVLALRSQQLVQDTWGLMSLLPVNTDIKADIHTMRGAATGEADSVDWDDMLDRRSILKLLYALQIIETEVEEIANASAADAEAQRVWCEKFMTMGGFKHLYTIVMDCDVSEMVTNSLAKKCLATLLKLVNHFMVVPDKFSAVQSTKEVPEDINYAGLVTRLLELMRETSRSAATVAKEEEVAEIIVDTSMESAPGGAGAGGSGGTGAGGAGAGAGAGTSSAEEPASDSKTNNDKKPTSVEAEVVSHTIRLLVAIVAQRPALLADLYAVSGISEAFIFGVLQTPEEAVREEVAKGILSLCNSLSRARLVDVEGDVKTPREFFLPLLFDELPQIYKHPSQCDQYIDLLRELVKAPSPTLARSSSAASDAAAGAGGGAGAGADSAVEVELTDDLGGVNPVKAVETLAKAIKTHPVVEASADDEDPVLRGLLRLTTSVLQNRAGLKAIAGAPDACDLCNEVFTTGLFAIPNADTRGANAPPKAKHPKTRKAAFGLLVELSHDSPDNHARLCALTLPHHNDPRFKPKKKVVRRSIWDFDSVSAGKSATGYVGLKNLGCICYMNATNQNFFMVPKFRHGVLQFDDEEEDKGESVMYQLQKMFANLQESERMYYDPKPFTVALKDMGEPTNVMVQKDASEYLGNLFMQIESQIQGTAQEKLLKNVFGGVLSNELVADGGHYSERGEAFSFLSVNVKNITNLDDALRDFISGDQVDYRWEEPDGTKKELPTQKRTSVKLLPPHLIIHLKRFEFDYATLRQKKLNTRFEFPVKLNMKPYTSEGRPDKVKRGKGEGKDEGKEEAAHPDEYYQYELMGVVVHTGTCDSGHYYSFIKERDSSYTGDGSDHRRWFQFNDTRVTPFAESMIERECYGGAETYGGRVVTSSSGGAYQRSRNAFVLFYDRVPSRLRAPPADADASGAGAGAGAGDGAGAGTAAAATPTSTTTIRGGIRAGVVASKMLASHRARKAMLANRGLIPPSIFKEIWEDNMEFWHKKNIFDPAYFDFVSDLSAVPDGAPVTEYPDSGVATEAEAIAKGGAGMTVVNLATAFVLETLVRSKARDALPKWVQKIKDIYASNIVACVWLLQSLMTHRTKLREYLLEGEQEATRTAVADIISFALSRVAEHERSAYPDPAHPPAPAPVSRKADAGSTESKGSDSKTEADSKDGGKEDDAAAEEPFAARPRQVAITFVETMLAMLPEAATNWRAFQQFFKVLGNFADLGAAERGYLLGRSLIAILLDFVLGKDSPHPELSGGKPRVAAAKDAAAGEDGDDAGEGAGTGTNDKEDGKPAGTEMSVVGTGLQTSAIRPVIGPQLPPLMRRVRMGDAQSRPNFGAVFDLLKPLVFACMPPSCDSDSTASPHQQPPCTPLPALDREMLTCDPFVGRLMGELTSTRMLNTVKPLVEHLCWEDEVLSTSFAAAIAATIKKEEYSSDLKPAFRAIALLSNIGDSRKDARLGQVLTAVLDEMKANSNFYVATDACIQLLMRVAKHHEGVRTWLKENNGVWAWVGEWLTANATAPVYRAGPTEEGGMQLHKPAQPHQGVPAERPAHIAANVARMLEGEDLVNDGYDSDDEPEVLVGMKVTVRWQGNKWYQGICEAYNPVDGMHFVHYGDGDKKWYVLDNKTWQPVGKVDLAWTAAAVANLQAAGGAVHGVTTRDTSGALFTIDATTLAANEQPAAESTPDDGADPADADSEPAAPEDPVASAV